MSKKTVSAIMLTLLLMSMLTLAFNVQRVKSEPTTIIVPDDYPTIQEAINAANPGDTIFVKTGTYYENVVANKSILLIGEDPTTTIVDGGGSPVRVVEITANAVAIKNFTIRNNCQVLSWESNNCIYVSDSNDTLIQNNVLTSEGGYGGGIVIYGSANTDISQNTIKTTPNIGVRLYDCSNNTIFRNDITNSSGIYLTSSSNNVIFENTITGYNEGNGVELGESTYNSVSGNTIKNMTWGMVLSHSSYNTISDNIITKNKEYGVTLFSSNYNNISENTVTANKYDGIYFAQLSDNNKIYRNNLMYNGGAGVALVQSSYSTVFENNLTNNQHGIRFVKLDTYSNSSKFYHNNFINNTKQVHAFFSDEYSTNIWDDGYPSGGNYWSDYTGADVNGDGVGDQPYVIDKNNQDSCPLMSPFNVQKPKASGAVYIRADGSIDPPTAPISTLDNVTYTLTGNIATDADGIVVERDNIVIDGAGYTVQGRYASGTGVDLSGRSNVTIKDTNIETSGYGLCLNSTADSVISGNNITNNYDGIYLYSSSSNSISGNNITANSGDGIRLGYSSNYNSISGNDITNNENGGIWLYSSSNYNSISGNDITNTEYGIILDSSSNYNSISGNNITANNWNGIRLNFASNNKFYHNNFIGNTQQVHTYVSGYANFWDDGYPSGGNYWSDYTGVDANGDGIGDTPYLIDDNNRDRYPLMNPWTPPEHDLAVSITTPVYLHLGSSTSLNATVTNKGLNDEVNVEFLLLINGTITNSTIIPLLQPWDSYTLSYVWTPTIKGKYNVTAYAPPVLGETSVENNKKTEFVTVSAPPQIGVKAGDWIKVDYTVTGAPPGTTLPLWLKVEFLSVEGTSATARVTMRMSDGTEQNATVPVDVVAGGQAFGLSGFVIPANLTVGDVVYMSGYGNITIAGETTGSYAGAGRTVIYASFSQYGTQLTYYWDKQTGVIVEASTTSGTMTGTGKATETNMWEPAPGFPIDPTLLYIVIAVVIVAAAVFLVMRKKKASTESTTPEMDSHE